MCGSKPASVTWELDGKRRTIPKKNAETLAKWTSGALARRQLKKLVLTKSIQGKLSIINNDVNQNH